MAGAIGRGTATLGTAGEGFWLALLEATDGEPAIPLVLPILVKVLESSWCGGVFSSLLERFVAVNLRRIGSD